ncbi:hypothetical protein GGU10DRAFT_82868 [Lentinula aff. detonsa]|uniref:COX assembly mitochondrial protein n=2 Tax=Lentinula TaxID=5352 RepID=A0AA38NNM0_9AGAR|nr:hypothetical protein GGU10DRAFT_82868 [Lentinula aff. detonsa]KAJ3987547.1 hypothetical protein F5890DRAFT_769432 [Lentinula detonsa]
MNALSRREEETLLKTVKAQALKECDPFVKDFADCMSGRLISVAWACKDKLKLVEACMVKYTGPEPMEVVRSEYLKLRDQQRETKVNNLNDNRTRLT